MKRFILAAFLFVQPIYSHAHGGGGDEGAKIGKGIIDFKEEQGFKLSPESQKRMQFAFQTVETQNQITIPKEALVMALSDTHVYLHIGEFFKSIDVKVISKGKGTVTVEAEHLKPGIQVVVKNVSFLRVIDLDLGGGEEDEHAH